MSEIKATLLDAKELARLHSISVAHIAVGGEQAVVGYALSFADSDAYDGEEFRWWPSP